MKKPLDLALETLKENAAKKGEMKPYLDTQLKAVQKLDNKIAWFENKIKEIEEDKQKELRKMNDLLELAVTTSHTLDNGYYVKPDNKRKVEVIDIGKFMKWLKTHKTSTEVFDFFKDAMKISKLKSFCDKEANAQRMNGELKPSIDGIDFGEITYRRLTTGVKK